MPAPNFSECFSFWCIIYSYIYHISEDKIKIHSLTKQFFLIYQFAHMKNIESYKSLVAFNFKHMSYIY